MSTRNFYIKTYGCQMNERDSEAVSCLLAEHGYNSVDREENADIIILNTCSVRETAENKARGKAGILSRLKKQRPELILIIIGCMAQNLGERLFKEIPHLDGVVGTDRLEQLPKMIAEAAGGRRRQTELETAGEINTALSGHQSDISSPTAFVSVMRGCNQHCSYCIVPRVRGPEKSRSPEDVINEVRAVARLDSCREVFLLGQNITAYGLAEARRRGENTIEISPIAELLEAIAEIPGIDRIRFTSPHPRHMNDRFIDTVTRLDKVCESFHIPLQSGSDRILKAMKRGYSVEDYRRVIKQLKSGMPNATFSTDVIVGFPGETEDDFKATRELMEETGFDMAYIFKYSPRAHTRAAEMKDDVPREVKEERNQILLKDLQSRAGERNQLYLGAELEVLLEGPSKRNPRRWSGRSRENKVCLVEASDNPRTGQIVQVLIENVTESSLFGRIV